MGLMERVFAGAYDHINGAMEAGFMGRRRAALVGPLEGRILEIGGGTGANLEHYRNAETVVVSEPAAPMRAKLTAKLPKAVVPIEVSDASADALPFPDASFDHAVSTLVLCTVPDVAAALAQIQRVLKPGDTLVFIEQGGGGDGKRGV